MSVLSQLHLPTRMTANDHPACANHRAFSVLTIFAEKDNRMQVFFKNAGVAKRFVEVWRQIEAEERAAIAARLASKDAAE
jgi:Rad3-related DNA helicase